MNSPIKKIKVESPKRTSHPRSYFLKTALRRPTDHKFMTLV